MKQYKVYLLDFDGTLIDSYDGLYTFYNYIFNPFGVQINKEQSYKLAKISLQEAFATLVSDANKLPEFIRLANEIVAKGILLPFNKIYPDAKKFIDYALKHNITLGMVTGNSKSHTDQVFSYLKLPDFLSVSVDSLEIRNQKPAPDGILLALNKINYQGDLKDVAYVGDAKNDYIAANNAGVTAIIVDRHNEFENNDNYIRIESLEELFNEKR